MTDLASPSPLALLPPASVKARRRPAAIIVVYAYELVWSLLVATPVHAWAKRVWGGHPDGDSALFQPGGLNLMGWLTGSEAAIGEALRTTTILLFVGAILAQLPLGMMLASLALGRNGRAPRTADALAVGWTSLVPLLLVLVVMSLAQGLVLGLGGGAAYAVDKMMAPGSGDANALRTALAVFAFAFLVMLFVGVIGDLWRAAVVRAASAETPPKTHTLLWTSLKLALRGRGLGVALVGWSCRAIIGFGAIVVGAFASQFATAGAALFGVFLVHQLLIAARVGLRASWLAQALRIVGQRAAVL